LAEWNEKYTLTTSLAKAQEHELKIRRQEQDALTAENEQLRADLEQVHAARAQIMIEEVDRLKDENAKLRIDLLTASDEAL